MSMAAPEMCKEVKCATNMSIVLYDAPPRLRKNIMRKNGSIENEGKK